MSDARADYLLRLGDDALILGQRLSEWCGHAPALEVDLSLANVALDLIGQAMLALAHARDTYTRRMEGVSLWVVPSKEIVASDPDQAGELFEPAESKIYRHPTFYDIPDEVKHI